MMGMTEKQQIAFEAIRSYAAKAPGGCPSYQEMAEFMGLRSKSGVYRVVLALEERGLVRRIPGRARAIEIVTDSEVHIPPDLMREIRLRATRRGKSAREYVIEAIEAMLDFDANDD